LKDRGETSGAETFLIRDSLPRRKRKNEKIVVHWWKDFIPDVQVSKTARRTSMDEGAGSIDEKK